MTPKTCWIVLFSPDERDRHYLEQAVSECGVPCLSLPVIDEDGLRSCLRTLRPDLVVVRHAPPLVDSRRVLPIVREKSPGVPVCAIGPEGFREARELVACGIMDCVQDAGMLPLSLTIEAWVKALQKRAAAPKDEAGETRPGVPAGLPDSLGVVADEIREQAREMIRHAETALRRIGPGEPIVSTITSILHAAASLEQFADLLVRGILPARPPVRSWQRARFLLSQEPSPSGKSVVPDATTIAGKPKGE